MIRHERHNYFLSIYSVNNDRLQKTGSNGRRMITVDETNNSFPKKELALQDFMDVEIYPAGNKR